MPKEKRESESVFILTDGVFKSQEENAIHTNLYGFLFKKNVAAALVVGDRRSLSSLRARGVTAYGTSGNRASPRVMYNRSTFCHNKRLPVSPSNPPPLRLPFIFS